MASYQGITYQDDESRAAVRAVFGCDLSPDDIGRLAGAREDDIIEIEGEGDQFEISMHSLDGTRRASFTVCRSDQDIVVRDPYVRNDGGAQGAGRDLVHAFDDMGALGVTKLEASAARSDADREHRLNGYYTWAKLGFMGEIPEPVQSAARERFGPKITHVEQLMRIGRVGEQWWKEHGDTWDATFSFAAGSYSMRMLDAWRSRVNRSKPVEAVKAVQTARQEG